MSRITQVTSRSAWLLTTSAVAAWWGWYFGVRTANVHFGLGTSAYDFGLYEQGVWLLSRFESPFVTLMGRNLLGDHSSFVLLLVAPLYWIIGSTALLLVVQALVVAAAAIPIHLATRQITGSDALGFVFGLVYLLHPAISWTVLENFHPDAFLGLFISMVWWAIVTRRTVWFWVSVALALSVKEDVAVILVGIGVWLSVRREWRRGIALIAVSLLTMLTMLFVVMRSFTGVTFRNSWRIPFGGPGGFLRAIFSSPRQVVDHFLSDGRPFYLFQMLAPTGFVFLRAPLLTATASLVLFVNVLSTFWYQYQIEYHYSIVAVPSIVIGTAWAIRVLVGRNRRYAVALVLACSVLTAYLWSPLPMSRREVPTWPPSHPIAVAAREIIEVIPPNASVTAQHSVTAHLARRSEIYMFPNPFKSTLYGPDVFREGDRLDAAETVEYVVLQRNLSAEDETVWALERDDFVEIAGNEYWAVYRRR